MRPVLTQADIEHRIMDTVDALEALVEDYADAARAAAEADSVYRRRKAMMFLSVIEHPRGDRKQTVAEVEQRVVHATADERETAKLAEAHRDSIREGMHANRDRLGALRTLAANVRAVTDPRLPS